MGELVGDVFYFWGECWESGFAEAVVGVDLDGEFMPLVILVNEAVEGLGVEEFVGEDDGFWGDFE